MSSPGTSTSSDAAVSRRCAWAIVAVLCAAYVLNYVDRQVVFSIFPALRRELQFTDAQLGLVGTVFLWVYSLCMPFTGRLSDVVPRGRLVLVSLVLWSLATCGTGLSGSASSFLFWRGMMGITESLYVPAALGIIAVLHPAATRSRALSMHSAAQFAGIAAGGWYGGWMADHIGWRSGLFALTAMGIAYTAVLAMAFRGLPRGPAGSRRTGSRPVEILHSRPYLALSAAFFFFCIMLWMLYAWLPNFIYERFHLSLTASGFIATAYLQASSAAGVLLGGVFGDRFARRVRGARFYVAGAGLVSCAPFAWLILAAPTLPLLEASAAAFGLLQGVFVANLFASAYDAISEANYGLGTGALNMVGGLAGGAGTFLAGLWKESIGIAGLMQWAAVATVVTASLMVFVVARENRAQAGA